jgi:hypothetical protein
MQQLIYGINTYATSTSTDFQEYIEDNSVVFSSVKMRL